MNWYYAKGTQPVGPLSDEDFRQHVARGEIQPDTLVWCEGWPEWKPYSTVQAQEPAAPPPPSGTETLRMQTEPAVPGTAPLPGVAPGPATGQQVVCAECGRTFDRSAAIQYGTTWVCAGCKPVFLQKLREGVAAGQAAAALVYGGFWIRFLAKFIDGLIISVVMFIPLMLLGVASFRVTGTLQSSGGPPTQELFMGMQAVLGLIQWIVQILYNGFFVGRFGATPAKMLLGLKVVTPEGMPVTYARAFGRAAAELLSTYTCLIGYIIAAFDNEKRTLHDHIASTRVIRT